MTHSEFVGIQVLVEKHASQIELFEIWASNSDWDSFHQNHYDWWAFPLDKPSSFGFKYTLEANDVIALQADAEFRSRPAEWCNFPSPWGSVVLV